MELNDDNDDVYLNSGFEGVGGLVDTTHAYFVFYSLSNTMMKIMSLVTI